MTNISFPVCRCLALAALLIGLVCAPARAVPEGVAAGAPARPNVVIIVADDMGFADVGFNGGTDIKTPNLDRLAGSGVKFNAFYVQPLCSPTRAALMTGRYPMRHGLQVGVVRPWATFGLPLGERTLAQGLKDAGYETAIVGKWHLGHFEPAYLPTARGFDHQYGHYNGAIDYNTHDRDGGLDWHRNDKALREEGYATNLLAKEAVTRIEKRDAGKPLFLYVPFNAVHSPHQVPAKYTEPYAALKGKRKTYAGMLAAMDEGIGQILDAIDKAGIRENTLIIFSSDNGGADAGTDNGTLRAAKGTLYEGGVRVAACAAWPGKIPAGGTVEEAVHIVDIYPTVLKLAGVDTSKQTLAVDGKDAWATIAQGAKSPHEEILLNATPTNGAIRMGDWKLIIGGGRGGPVEEDVANAAEDGQTPAKGNVVVTGRVAVPPGTIELFNLATDRSEKTNLAKQHPEKVKELRAAYDKLAAQAVPPKNQPMPKDYKAPAIWGEK